MRVMRTAEDTDGECTYIIVVAKRLEPRAHFGHSAAPHLLV